MSTVTTGNLNPENNTGYTDSYVQKIAKTCHEVNRVYCLGHGDSSQPLWKDAPEWQKDSAISGVVYYLQNPYSKPEDIHNNWLKVKKEDGWVYGEVKDPENKTHPCIVPYEELDLFQKVKDTLFLSVVRSF